MSFKNTIRRRENKFSTRINLQMVVLGHGSLSFEDLDCDCVLVVGSGGEDLRLLGGDNSVARDKLGHHTSDGLDTHGQWVDVQENDLTGVLLSGENSSLDGGSESDGLIGVDASGWLLSVEELLDELLNLGDTSGASDENDLIDVLLLHVSVFKNLLHGLHGRTEEIHVEFFKLGTGQSFREIFSFEQGLNLNPDLLTEKNIL